MAGRRLLWLLPLLGLGAVPAWAAGGDGIQGVALDQTVTLLGGRFHAAFAAAWLQDPAVEQENVTLIERPSARWGSLVWVEHQRQTLFRATLQPGRTDVEQLGRQAAAQVAQRVEQRKLERVLMREPDLGRDEI